MSCWAATIAVFAIAIAIAATFANFVQFTALSEPEPPYF